MEDTTTRNYAESFGTKLYYGNYDATLDFNTQADPSNLIAGVDDFPGGAGVTVDKYAYLRQDQDTQDETVIPKRIVLGDLSLTLGFNKAKIATMESLVGVIKFWKILMADGSKVIFPGYLSGLDRNFPKTEEIKHPVKIQPHKRPSFVAAP